MKVVGIQHSQGTFKSNDNQNISFDNYVLYVTDAEQKGLIAGVCPRTIKIKSNRVADILASLGMNDIKALMNKNIVAYYDAYKNVCKIDVI